MKFLSPELIKMLNYKLKLIKINKFTTKIKSNLQFIIKIMQRMGIVNEKYLGDGVMRLF